MTIDEFCNKLELLLYDNVVKDSEDGTPGDENLFFEYDWDAETWWIKLGLPDEWFDNGDEEDE